VIARSHNLTELLNDVTAHEMQAITGKLFRGKYFRLHALRHLEPCQMLVPCIESNIKIVLEQA
jgi:tRNA(adenine34) deaminase